MNVTIRLRPGVLLLPHCGTAGGIKTEVLSQDTRMVGVAEVIHTDSERTVYCAAQRNAARATMMALRRGAEKLGASVGGGLIFVPRDRNDALDAWIASAVDDAASHNKDIPLTYPGVEETTLVYADPRVFAIASDDEWAARQAARELDGITRRLSDALAEMNPDKLREAAAEAARFAPVLETEQQTVLQEAINAAKVAAKQVKKAAKKGPEAFEAAKAEILTGPIDLARSTFGFEPEPAPGTPPVAVVAAQDLIGRALDFEPATDVPAPVAVSESAA